MKKSLIAGHMAFMALALNVAPLFAQETAPSVQVSPVILQQVEKQADEALQRLYERVKDSKELVSKSRGVLIMPEVVAGGAILGVEYGRGVLRTEDGAHTYYNLITGSIGAKLGMEKKTVVLLFLTQEALDRFRNGQGWTAGIDGSVTIATKGVAGSLDTNTVRSGIVGYIVTSKGLMLDASLTGGRFTKVAL